MVTITTTTEVQKTVWALNGADIEAAIRRQWCIPQDATFYWSDDYLGVKIVEVVCREVKANDMSSV